MLGQPMYFLTPDVVGVHLTGALRGGVTATDLVLDGHRDAAQAKVVGKFVEFFGEGVAILAVPDRATIGNMAPEYGATIGFFPVDDARSPISQAPAAREEQVDAVHGLFQGAGPLRHAEEGRRSTTARCVELDLATVAPALAGPKRPQDRIELGDVKAKFHELFAKPVADGGYGKAAPRCMPRFPTGKGGHPASATATS